MRIFDLFQLAFLNLRRKLSRTFLSALGVGIGCMCVILMLAIGLTDIQQFTEMIAETNISEMTVTAPNTQDQDIRLTDRLVSVFESYEHVENVIAQRMLSIQVKYGKRTRDEMVYAIPEDKMTSYLPLQEGRYPVNTDKSKNTISLLVGYGYYLTIFKKTPQENTQITDSFELILGTMQENMPTSKRYTIQIVGILESEMKNVSEDINDMRIYMTTESAKIILKDNYKLAYAMSIDPDNYDVINVYADDFSKVEEITKKIRSLHFEAYNNMEWITQMEEQQNARQGQLFAIGFVSLLVSAIGIINTMMTGIMERKKEIGIMKVIGVSIKKIQLLFLIEAAFLGILGGAMGILFSQIGNQVFKVNELEFFGVQTQYASGLFIPLSLNLSVIGLAILLSMLAGMIPARKIVGLSPLEAMRG